MFTVTENNTITIPRGDTASLSVELTTEEGEQYEVKENDTLTLRVKKNLADKEPCIQKEITGSVDFEIKPEDTEGLTFGSYIYSVRLITAENKKYTVIDKSSFIVGEVV